MRYATIMPFLLASSLMWMTGCSDESNSQTECEPGETRPSSDGCNTCQCTEEGEWACTGRACADVGMDADATDVDAGNDDTSSDDAIDDADGQDPVTCELPAPFDIGASYANELYVAPGGDDSADGSEQSPLATIEEAARLADPGTRIHLAAGTYQGGTFIGDLQGTAEAPIAIVAEQGAVIDGGNTGLQLSDPRYLVLEGLTVRGAAQNGLNIDDGGTYETPAEFIVLRDITVEDVGSGGNEDCIKLSGVDDFWVIDSDVSTCTGQGIDMVGCHDGVITGNAIHDKPSSGIQAKGGTADILIHGNRFSDVTGRGVNAGGSTGLEFFRPDDAPYEGARIQVVANIFERVGAESGAPIAYVGCDACTFANNTVYEPKTWVARILQETTGDRFVASRDGLFINNIVVFNTADIRNGTFVNVGPDTAPETFTFANNLWYAMDDPDFSGPSLSGGIPAPTDSVVQQDPQFTRLNGSDYYTTVLSPAFLAGQNLPLSYPDFDGRCYEDPPSLGAYKPQPTD